MTILPDQITAVLAGWASGTGPLYRRLAEALRSAIRRGELPSGTRLPTERALAAELSVSRSTVVAAYGLLRREGWVASRQGSGTWVRRHATAVRFGEERPGFVGRSTASFRALIEGPGDAIEFTIAALPAGDLFSRAVLRRVLADLDAAGRRAYGYEVMGHPPLRRAIARYLTQRWGLPTGPEEVIVTTGAQQAVNLAAMLYARPGDAVVVEDPTYLSALDAFTAAGLRPVAAPIGVQGLRPERLRAAIAASAPRFAYVMPTFHNPAGTLVPERERRELARVAEELQVPIVEDHTVSDLSLGEEPPPPIGAFQGEIPVLTIGSLSKLLWGGLRTGWVRGPAPVIERLARIKLVADHGSSSVSQVVAVRLFEEVEEIRRERRALIRERKELLEALLRERLPDWTWNPPAGGLSLWVRLPVGDAGAFAAVAARHGVTIVPGAMSSAHGGFADHLRLPYVLEPEPLREGVERLARAWEEYVPQVTAPSRVRVVV